MTHEEIEALQRRIDSVARNAGQPGYNEHGLPLHACNGYRQDEHYWAWLRAKREGKA